MPGLVVTLFDCQETQTFAAGSGVSVSTRFPLASVTKTFTADLVLRLAAVGRVDLDEPLRGQLPGFRLSDPLANDTLTPRDALCHFSGLPPHTWSWVFSRESRKQFTEDRLPCLESSGPHRGCHRYSNLMYAVLGRLVAEAGAYPDWETALAHEILGPLGMMHTSPLCEGWAEREEVAPPHADGEPPCIIPPFHACAGHPIAPASELIGTMPDLARWGQAMLQLSPDDPRWEPHNTVESNRPEGMGDLFYGLGWRVERVGARLRVWHSGQCSGYSVLLSLYPEEGRGIALAANRSGCTGGLHALDFSLNLQQEGLAVFPPPPPPSASLDSGPGAGFLETGALPCGRYVNPGYGALDVMDRGGRLWLSFQETCPVPLREGRQGPEFTLPVYGARFSVRWKAGMLRVPFEPDLPAICFRQTVR